MSHGDIKARRDMLRPMLIALNLRPQNGPIQAAALLHRMAAKQDRTLYAKSTGQGPRLPGWSTSALYWAFAPLTKEEIDNAYAEIQRAEAAQVSIVTWKERGFPTNLHVSESPPPVLYIKGKLLPQDRAAIAIVGSRSATREYMELAADLAYGLAKKGYTIVSGLARGVDRYAHEGALEAGGRTLAVMGSGVDVIYPPEHRRLASSIASRGALISFYPMGTPPSPYRFPARNWVIAGLSTAVIVVQGAAKSGAIITANAAAAMGKEVMAVPGPLGHPLSAGTHGLIQDGAKLVTSAQEVIDALRSAETAPTDQLSAYLARRSTRSPKERSRAQPSPVQLSFPEDSPEANIVARLANGACSVEELARTCDLGIGQAQAALMRLEIQGRIVSVDGGKYRLMQRGESN